MTGADTLLAILALGVAIYLARGTHPVAAVLLVASALLVAAILFLPTPLVTGWVGMDRVNYLYHLARRTPLSSSDWLHVVVFTWLGLLIWLGRRDLRSWRGGVVIMVLAVTAEVGQWLADGREPSVWDAALNVVGALIGIGAAAAALRFKSLKGDAGLSSR